jgi:transposase-like protein
MDEVFIRIQGVQNYLWRAVDQDGVVLDILVQRRRDGQAAKRFFRRLLKDLDYMPRVIVTDKLQSYSAARRQLLSKVEHRQSHYLNNRAENRIDRHDAENARCNDSNRLSRLRTSFPLTHSSMATSILAAICWPEILIAQSDPKHSTSGSRRHALNRLRDRHNISARSVRQSDRS